MMLTIVTPDLTKINPCAKGYIRELLEGEMYEQALCDAINETYPHLKAFRPRQRFLDPEAARHYNKRLADPRLSLEHRQRLEIARLQETQKTRLRPQQSDVWIRSGTRTYHLEVKALTAVAFRCNPIHFGCTAKFDQKIRCDWFNYRDDGSTFDPDKDIWTPPRRARAIPFDAVALINGTTGETWLTPHWTQWDIAYDLGDKTTSRELPDKTIQATPVLDYATPAHHLEPLDLWLETL